jgi:hypothetical protein
MHKRFEGRPRFKKILAILLIGIGIFSLLTPFTPGSWLLLVGIELLGWRLVFFDKINEYFTKRIKK